MNEPLVSVIMPAYNAEEYIEESILSVINQTYQNWELLIINDGSTDQTLTIAQKFIDKDSRIRLMDNEKNKGLIITRNIGLNNVHGKYIANLDSDDIAMPERLKRQVAFLEKNKDYALIGAACIQIDFEGKKIATVERNIANSHLKSLLLFSNYFINSTVMLRATDVQSIRYQNGFAPAEDYQLFSQIAEYSKIGNLSDCLVKYRIHDQNISSLKETEQQIAISSIVKTQLSGLGLTPTDEELKLHLNLVDGVYDSSELPKVEAWLLKLVDQNNGVRKYPVDILNHFCGFFYRRACERSNLGLKAVQVLRKSSLSKFIKYDLKGNSIFFVKSILKRN